MPAHKLAGKHDDDKKASKHEDAPVSKKDAAKTPDIHTYQAPEKGSLINASVILEASKD